MAHEIAALPEFAREGDDGIEGVLGRGHSGFFSKYRS